MQSLLLLSCVVFSLTATVSGVSTTGSLRDDPISVLLVAHTDTSHVMMMSAIGEALVLRGHNVTLCTTEREGTDLPRQLAKRLGMAFLSAGLDFLPTVQHKYDDALTDHHKFIPRSPIKDKVLENRRKIATKLLSDPSYASDWDILVADQNLYGATIAFLSTKWSVPFIALSTFHDFRHMPPWPYPLPPFGYTQNLTFSQRLALALYKPVYESWKSTEDQINGVPVNCSQDSDPYQAVNGYVPVIHSSVIGLDYSHPILPAMHYVGPLIIKSEETPSKDL